MQWESDSDGLQPNRKHSCWDCSFVTGGGMLLRRVFSDGEYSVLCFAFCTFLMLCLELFIEVLSTHRLG